MMHELYTADLLTLSKIAKLLDSGLKDLIVNIKE